MNQLKLITIILISIVLLICLNYLIFYKHIIIYKVMNHDNSFKKEEALSLNNQLQNKGLLQSKEKSIHELSKKVIIPKIENSNQLLSNNKNLMNEIKKDITRLHTVTYASHHGRDDRFCRAIESAVRHQYDLVILGWNIPWKGLSQKLEAAHTYASSIPPNDLLLFTDAFDVLFTSSPSEIIKQFKFHNTSILFSAECGCWPHIMENRGYACFHKYPSAPTPYRYLNSGSWIGKASAAKEMLAEVIREAGKDFKNANDQKLVADMFISKKFDISLDYYNTIFQSMHMTLDPPLPRCNPYEDIQISSSSFQSNNNIDNHRNIMKDTWYNKRTHGKPAVIHFNGGGKRYHLEMDNKMWYKKNPYNRGDYKESTLNYTLIVPSVSTKKMTFKELCSNYIH